MPEYKLQRFRGGWAIELVRQDEGGLVGHVEVATELPGNPRRPHVSSMRNWLASALRRCKRWPKPYLVGTKAEQASLAPRLPDLKMRPIFDTLAVVERHQHAAPVNLSAIARDLGIAVYEESFDDTISGKLTRDGRAGGSSGFAIYVNRRHHPNRRRFTLAHEIAHFILHRDLIESGLVDDTLYRSGMSDAQEVQANRLAAEILMPSKLIQNVYAEQRNVGILANMFGVSEAAMKIRIETLNLTAGVQGGLFGW